MNDGGGLTQWEPSVMMWSREVEEANTHGWEESMRYVGIDGCRDGWVIALVEGLMQPVHFKTVSRLDAVFEDAAAGRTMVAIDVPIGLSDNQPRACDVAARRLLGTPRASSVFPAPCRPAVAASTWREASESNAVACGKRLSQQSWAILQRIKDVDQLMTPALQASVREAHPEVTFAVISRSGHGLEHKKKSLAGRQQRQQALSELVPEIDVADVRMQLGRRGVGADDILDAVACLVTAIRLVSGNATTLPADVVEYDARGLRMEIVA
jgi:predicted RNase H-like nuclease